jgi:beta-lactamase superfamily II metal-dependent hydrolase
MIDIEANTSSLVVRVAFLDVGQGDTIVISCAETHEAYVVDCINADAVLDYLQQEQVQFLRNVIITHLHADHYNHVADLLDNYSVIPDLSSCEALVCNDYRNRKDWARLQEDGDLHSSSMSSSLLRKTPLQDLRRWIASNKRKYSELKLGASVGPLKGILANNIKILHPYGADYPELEAKGLNNTSIAMRVIGPGANASVLLTGDLEPIGWHRLLENHSERDIHSNVLKFPHHGGTWGASDTIELLNAVQPSIVIFSVGTDGEKYKHPNREVFEILASPPYTHIRVLCTQATKQCCTSIEMQRTPIIQHLNKLAYDRGQERIGSKRGCPCAGTIIVELNEKASIVQPSLLFHKDSIVLPHFNTHKCTLL